MCCTDEDKIGECVLDGRVDAGAIGDVKKSEQGKDETEKWDLDEREIGVENVVAYVDILELRCAAGVSSVSS